jgi:hypothetical protein
VRAKLQCRRWNEYSTGEKEKSGMCEGVTWKGKGKEERKTRPKQSSKNNGYG